MTKLDCNVVNCSYNADNCCRRTDIQVEGTQAKTSSETCCGSFAPKGSGCQSCHTTDVKKDTTVRQQQGDRVRQFCMQLLTGAYGRQTAALPVKGEKEWNN